MPTRPAIKCESGLLKHQIGTEFVFDAVTMRHVRLVEGEAPADVIWRCCSDTGIYCGESLDTPHVPVPEPPVYMMLGVGLIMAVLLVRWRRGHVETS